MLFLHTDETMVLSI